MSKHQHPMLTYLERNNEKLYGFAERAKVPGTSLARALAGERGLSLSVALRVERVTRGAVPASCWEKPGPQKQRPAA